MPAPESDVAALAAIRLVMAHLPDAVREPQNLSARAGMLDAAALGGLAIHKAARRSPTISAMRSARWRPCRTASP